MRAEAAVILFFFSFAVHVTGLVTNPPVENGGTVTVVAPENASNVTIYCAVTGPNNMTMPTVWFHIDSNANPTRRRISNNDLVFSIGALPFANLTIKSFAQSLDGTTFECSNQILPLQIAFFALRIIKPPVLMTLSTPLIAVEGSQFSYTYIVQAPGFPHLPSYQWTHNGLAINTTTSTNPNVSVYPNIVFSSVVRTQSGNYSMTASTEGGDSTGYFILDVQYAVEADVSAGSQFCVPVGGSITLVAFTNIAGNPDPTSSWELIGGTLMGDTTGRQLNISDLKLNNSGNYTNTLTNTVNGTENRMNRTIELQVLSSPTAPRMLSVVNLTDESSSSIVLQWQNPSSSGVPAFNRFLVELVSMTPPNINVNKTVTATSTDPSYINTFTVTGLKPNTNYTASVRVVLDMSCMEQGVDLPGPISNQVSFMTMLGGPKFSGTSVSNIEGKLRVTWSFQHMGGVPLTDILVTCFSVDECGCSISSSKLVKNLTCGTTAIICDNGTVLLPSGSDNVTAGTNYSCTVTATDTFTSVQQVTNYIVATSGVPSLPVINHAIATTLGVMLIVQLRYAGHPSMITVLISAGNEGGNNVTFIRSTAVSSNLNNYVFEIPLPPGVYRFIVHASNTFGSTGWSKEFPSIGLNGFQVTNKDICTCATTYTTTIVLPTSTTIAPANTLASCNAVTIGLGSGLGVCLIVVAIQFAVLLIIFCLYITKVHEASKGNARTHTRADMQYEPVDSHGQQQNIELQSNAAYASWVK